jgi:hypothetical protein
MPKSKKPKTKPATQPKLNKRNLKTKAVTFSDKGYPKYNWAMLKLEFFQGPWSTASHFRREMGLRLPGGAENARIVAKMKGWAEEKEEWQSKIIEKATDKLAKETEDDVKKVKARQARLARWMALKGAQALEGVDTDDLDPETARKLIVDGLKQEREALGVGKEKKGGGQGAQVHINLPETRLDEFIEKADYKDILRLVGEVRRRRTAISSGEVIDAEGEGEVQQGGAG